MTASRHAASGGNELATLLADGIDRLGLSIDAEQQARLLDYQMLLAKWNASLQMTSIRDPRQMVIKHLLDSLSILPRLDREPISHVLDVGSGGGLPGVVLAIVRPDWQVTVNDIVHKKTAFLTQARATFKLTNLTVVTGRVESLVVGKEVPAPFDAIVSRAFAELSDFVTLARNLLAPGGSFWAMKGVAAESELALPEGCELVERLALHVPFLDAERHLLRVKVTG
ncbi:MULTISPECIES: 16S rRNA (guanine(527)-N(7))-methyltransferase RsmG [Pandoraea]|uniref:16S rRNA (guanine(527)-N(7))-methyltransferase RsmG n=1 Tax=Pandoraea TaxID=93217 RepID=UPI001F5C11AC|nr:MULTISPECIES: 16S rRNA (guanine(527)-N(7))-methyltransferase RsmG [Pandoraea]MCI3207072.1 16S rRNA (guanine(527)-N(7))-methyltransferase RsmG [Pandoraea sp. LA3]MDN4585100.1 16S rRNA (guanine(527)-N(7))-methyltransferase RsmG [Pandoraea capi]